jgi:hypothetical protein
VNGEVGNAKIQGKDQAVVGCFTLLRVPNTLAWTMCPQPTGVGEDGFGVVVPLAGQQSGRSSILLSVT